MASLKKKEEADLSFFFGVFHDRHPILSKNVWYIMQVCTKCYLMTL